jgi:acyl phosphate:glycerol-3-phosphate acyltransferase
MNLGLWSLVAACFVLGGIPTAWIARRLQPGGKDLRSEGSGNIGARNLWDVGSSKLAAVVVGVLDALKGVLAVLLAQWLHGDWFEATAWAGVAVVFGHNYSVFLRMKGGRGLATAVGVFALVNPLVLILWGITYLTGYYVIRRNIHIACMTAIIGSTGLIWSLPNSSLIQTMLVGFWDITEFRLMVAGVACAHFLRHIEPVREAIQEADEEDDDTN